MTGFYTRLQDAIVQSPFPLPDGQTELTFDGEQFVTLANINAENGNLYGLSLNLLWNFANLWNLTSSFNYLKGTTTDTDGGKSPMAHIPPIYGRTAVAFEAEKIEVEAVVRYNGAKKLADYSTNSADNIEYATPEGTLAWVTFNLYSTYSLPRGFEVQLALENLTDQHYRPFASGVSAPGRNVSMSLRWLF